MAKLDILKAATDVTVYLFIQDSSQTDGRGLTGLVFNTGSLVCYYVRPLAAAAQLNLATQTVTGAHSDGGFVEVDSGNMPGIYRLDLSDAICATGVNSVVVMLKGAANMAPIALEIQLTSYNPNDAVRMGMTALPNANAEAAGGLFTRGSGAGQINQQANGQIDANVERLRNTAQSATDLQDFADAGYDPSTNKVQGVVLVDTLTTYTGNTPQTGDAFARIGANGAGLTALGDARIANLDATVSSRASQASVTAVGGDVTAIGIIVTAIQAKTDQLTFTIANKVDSSIQAAGDFAQAAADKVWLSAARTLTSFGTLVADIWASATRTLTSFGTLTADVADKLLGRAIAGGADGGRTVADALKLLRNRRAIAAGTLTAYEEDDTTPAWTAAVGTAASDPVNSIDPA